MSKRILITGASGFLGTILTDSLKRSGYLVKTLGKKASNEYQIDLDAPKPGLMFDESFDIVIHAAGKAHSVPKTEIEKQAFYQTNYEGTKNLCAWLTSNGKVPKSFIFISTVAVYGLTTGTLVGEDHPLNGTSPYAQSKIIAENWLANWSKAHQVTLAVLRLPLLAGPNPPGNLGAMIRGISKGRYLSIGRADARKSILSADDIPAILPLLAEKGGIYNLTDGYHPSFGELETAIATALGKKQPPKVPEFIARILAQIGNLMGNRSPINTDKLEKILSPLTFDDTKARDLLLWQPTSVLEKIKTFI